MNKALCVFLVGLAATWCADAPAQVTLEHTDRGSFINPFLPPGSVASTDGFRAAESPAQGDNYQIRAVNSGFLTPTPLDDFPVQSENNFHTFDLSSLTGSITGATLRIFAEAGSYDSSGPSETIDFFDVATPAEVLTDPLSDTVAAGGAFVDLGSGVLFGSFEIFASDDNSFIDVVLNADAIDSLNDAVGTGPWSIGGTFASVDGSFNAGNISERVLQSEVGFSPASELVLTGSVAVVPEPTSAALALLACGWFTRRRLRR